MDSNPDLCDSGAVLHQLSYELVRWVGYKLVDVEIDDVNTRIFLAFERGS